MRRSIICFLLMLLASAILYQCANPNEMNNSEKKVVIYQVLPRLYGNANTTNKPWGTIQENGVGKFNDFTPLVLDSIKALGVTHIWYTGVPHHAVITDYSLYGISPDDPDVVKGRAGSPYAIRDYYNVNPDLAVDPKNRLEEFEALIKRTHDAGLKVIMDIVPNHVARDYRSLTNPEGVVDFGSQDDTSVEYRRDNNFYYIPGEDFQVPDFEPGFEPLGGEAHPLRDGEFHESPAKWTGNGSRRAKPDLHDWYETVKVNFGVRPDGLHDFDPLPQGYAERSVQEHHAFWMEREVPDSWKKFEQIAHYWLAKGVDGFRYDMAQMVPVEFWSYLNSSIKVKYPDAMLVSEIYVPEMYRDYIHLGKMDYLYDKVQLYDTLKSIVQGTGSTDHLSTIWDDLKDIEHHMLHFLENHDEHRIASPEFAGYPRKAMPAMVVSATLGTSPTMVYFGQEVGEPGEGDAGFGKSGRTTIFDYWGVPMHQKWFNEGRCDGALLSEEQRALRRFYYKLLNFTLRSDALMGETFEIHTFNRNKSAGYTNKDFSFLRWREEQRLLVVVNFGEQPKRYDLQLPRAAIQALQLSKGSYLMNDQLGSGIDHELLVTDSIAKVSLQLPPYGSLILKF